MRKLKLQVNMSIDSYIAGPNGEMDWMVWNWDDKLKKYVYELNEPVDTNLLGRKMTDGFVSYWSDVMTKPDDPSSIDRSHVFAKKMIDTPKVVFTKTLKKSQWANTDIATGDLTDEISKLKSLKGKDMIVYGGASFDSSLIRAVGMFSIIFYLPYSSQVSYLLLIPPERAIIKGMVLRTSRYVVFSSYTLYYISGR